MPASSHATQDSKPTIVLVHGAFADATGWQKVITLLEKDGYKVATPQNPLHSLADDVATTKRVIEMQEGPVVLVGHSYGGAVISGAGADEPNVKVLVYIAAFAPDAGEPVGAWMHDYPTDLVSTLVPDSAGYVYIDPARYHPLFCADVTDEEANIMAIVQKPIAGAIFKESNPVAAWRTVPSWYLVAQGDKAINPDLERFYAKRMGAQTSESTASHVVFISQPQEAVAVILEAAKSVAG